MYQVVCVLVRSSASSLHTSHLVNTSNKYTIRYQTGPGQIVFAFMSGILVPQSCLFLHESPRTTYTVKADLNSWDRSHRASNLTFMGKIQASVYFFGRKCNQNILKITC